MTFRESKRNEVSSTSENNLGMIQANDFTKMAISIDPLNNVRGIVRQ